jgi:hypothetical protein
VAAAAKTDILILPSPSNPAKESFAIYRWIMVFEDCFIRMNVWFSFLISQE